MVESAIMSGKEAVAVTKAQEKKIQVAEMKMLRWSLGLTRKDRVKNEEIIEGVKLGDIPEKIRDSWLWWLGHVVSRND